MNIHPLNSFTSILCVFGALFLFAYLMIDLSFIPLILFIALAGFPIYRTIKRRKHTRETVMHDVQEEIVYRTQGYHSNLKIGHLGITRNYLFFVPYNKKEQAVIIRGSFLENIEIAPYNSGNYMVQSTSFGTFGSNIKWQAFHCSGVTGDNESFGFSWIVPSSKEGKKLMKKINKMDNVDFETSVGSSRKLY